MSIVETSPALPVSSGTPAPGRITVATWNINSVRFRLASLRRFVREARPDVVCLQETKVVDDDFPMAAVRRMGFRHVAVRGEKGYNGVAILSRLPLANVGSEGWCGRTDCRHLRAELPGGIVVHNFYVPAGGDLPDPEQNPKFAHKLRFLQHMAEHFAAARREDARLLLVGDLNVAPLETDVWSHKALLRMVTHTPVEVALMQALQDSHGWVDAVRHFVPPEERLYTWWSYRSPEWAVVDKGRRLDHIWASPALAPHLAAAEVVKAVRGWKLASDHAPVMVSLDLEHSWST